MKLIELESIEEFDWNQGNTDKNWKRHKVFYKEIEEVFLDEYLILNEDIKHSLTEKRYHCLGSTINSRLLFISFTFRDKKIRPISARDMNRKERKIYEKKTKTNTKI